MEDGESLKESHNYERVFIVKFITFFPSPKELQQENGGRFRSPQHSSVAGELSMLAVINFTLWRKPFAKREI